MGISKELKQQIIMAMAIMQDVNPGSDEYVEALNSVTGAGPRFDYSITIPDPASIRGPADLENLVNDVARQAVSQVWPQVADAIAYALRVIYLLMTEVKTTCPEFDVQEFVSQRGLELAEEE